MSEPEIEIARRCTFCGVSMRQNAMFCPQCGNPVKQQTTPTSISVSDTIIENAPAETVPLTPPKPRPVLTATTDHSVRGRVEHIRKVSSVVIDQAAYDPSLRFLLVAAVLFIFFLVLLIMSKVIG